MGMQMMCTDAMDAVDVFDSDHGALANAGWKPGNVGHVHRMERMDQPSDCPVYRPKPVRRSSAPRKGHGKLPIYRASY